MFNTYILFEDLLRPPLQIKIPKAITGYRHTKSQFFSLCFFFCCVGLVFIIRYLVFLSIRFLLASSKHNHIRSNFILFFVPTLFRSYVSSFFYLSPIFSQWNYCYHIPIIKMWCVCIIKQPYKMRHRLRLRTCISKLSGVKKRVPTSQLFCSHFCEPIRYRMKWIILH